MYAYIASHNYGATLVLDDGRVFEQRDQPGGSSEWYLTEEGVDIDAWTDQAAQEWDADWRELSDEEIAEHIDLEEAANYYVGEPPRSR
jgi:hypothetical protein